MKFPKYLTKAYLQKTYGSLSGVGDFTVTLTKFSKTATTLKATVEVDSSFGDSKTDILMKVGKTTTSLSLKIEAEGYSSKLAYSTAQTKAGLTIKATYTDSFNTKMNYSLNLEKDGDFSKFKLVYALGTEKMTITSTKISGDVVTFKAVDGDGDVIGTAKINLKAFGSYYDKSDKYLFDSSKTAELFSKIQLKFTSVKKAGEPADDDHSGADAFVFKKMAAPDGDHDTAAFAARPFAIEDASDAAGADAFHFAAAHDLGQPVHASDLF
ncbi:hypothetical protein KYK30_03290 [Shinella yambaruensis]|uniref:Uncharacterized protein n=1 Tax=Shinella yambaruensis TaxID=415996 RepID=A0ABQ5ZCW3_9HYPH|nr:hypothetical protein [Shinella yambaruensis]MCJ8024147.1 hypothetical protein [Shinella yambaruensis]MCU7978704.1 hypothetical protein [Shinella yambaruensis]GLR49445.1 hypothetical protein GCM10007923_06500 [Shinella yambaruensis]